MAPTRNEQGGRIGIGWYYQVLGLDIGSDEGIERF